jgi:hypothetical protein
MVKIAHLQIYGSELKKVMERFIQHSKNRIECFDDNFPGRKPECDRQHIWNWLKLDLLYSDEYRYIRFMKFFVIERG